MPRAALVAAACLTLLVAGSGRAERFPRSIPATTAARWKRLQRALGIAADGIYGKGTARRVRRFQRRHHLRGDAIVGAQTWGMLRRSGHTAARHGAARPTRSVTLLQRRLGIASDGVFGPGTQRAVRPLPAGPRPDARRRPSGPSTWSALGVHGRRPVLKRMRLGGGSSRSSSGLPIAVVRAIAAGNRIAHRPYTYGGGHGSVRVRRL